MCEFIRRELGSVVESVIANISISFTASCHRSGELKYRGEDAIGGGLFAIWIWRLWGNQYQGLDFLISRSGWSSKQFCRPQMGSHLLTTPHCMFLGRSRWILAGIRRSTGHPRGIIHPTYPPQLKKCQYLCHAFVVNRVDAVGTMVENCHCFLIENSVFVFDL